MRPRARALAGAAVLALAAPAAAGPKEWGPVSASGALKNLFQYGRAPLTGRPHGFNLTRARATLDAALPLAGGARSGPEPAPGGGASPPGRVRAMAHVDYDHELRSGAYFHTLDYRALGLAEPEAHLPMEQTISTGGSYHYRHRLYRAWAGLEGENWDARFGRQRVAWGTGKLWNPVDVVNPYEPTSIEREERRGADAVTARRALGTLAQAEAAWALGDRWASTALLGRVKGHLGGADLGVLGGKVAGSTSSWMAGSELSMDLWEGNLHSELSFTDARTRSSFWRFMAGYEYSFSPEPRFSILKDTWLLVEYFHNGAGEVDERLYVPARLLSGREVALAKDYAGCGLTKGIHPLLKLEVFGLVNLDDRSHFVGPALTWEAAPDLHLTAGFQRFGGTPRSEYGRLANAAYAQAAYFW